MLAVDDSLFDCDWTTEVLAADDSRRVARAAGDGEGPRATVKATWRNFEKELVDNMMFDQ